MCVYVYIFIFISSSQSSFLTGVNKDLPLGVVVMELEPYLLLWKSKVNYPSFLLLLVWQGCIS